jgi:hypothetical protein
VKLAVEVLYDEQQKKRGYMVSAQKKKRRRGVTRCVHAATPQRTPVEKRRLRTAQLRLSFKWRLNSRKTAPV